MQLLKAGSVHEVGRLFEEQPIPLIFITRSGSTPISHIACMMRSEMECGRSRRRACSCRPVLNDRKAMWLLLDWLSRLPFRGLPGRKLFGDGASIQRQSVEVQNAAQFGNLLAGQIELQQAAVARRGPAPLRKPAHAGHKVVNLVREG